MLKTSSYLTEAFDAINRTRERSRDLNLSERYGFKGSSDGLFDRDILTPEGEVSATDDKFKQRPGEKILIKLDGIVWVENLSIGILTLTDQRLFYQPQFYDLPRTTKNLEIPLDHINSIGHWMVKAVSGIAIWAGGKNAKIEFISKVPFKLIKMWRALKPINKGWKIIGAAQMQVLGKKGKLGGWLLAGIGVAAGAALLKGGSFIKKFLSR